MGSLKTQFPTLTDTGQTFDHDGDGGSSTAEKPVKLLSSKMIIFFFLKMVRLLTF